MLHSTAPLHIYGATPLRIYLLLHSIYTVQQQLAVYLLPKGAVREESTLVQVFGQERESAVGVEEGCRRGRVREMARKARKGTV